MSGEEIRKQVSFYEKQLEEKYNVNFFTFQKEAAEIIEKIEQLQLQCSHEFENGICKYCNFQENFKQNP